MKNLFSSDYWSLNRQLTYSLFCFSQSASFTSFKCTSQHKINNISSSTNNCFQWMPKIYMKLIEFILLWNFISLIFSFAAGVFLQESSRMKSTPANPSLVLIIWSRTIWQLLYPVVYWSYYHIFTPYESLYVRDNRFALAFSQYLTCNKGCSIFFHQFVSSSYVCFPFLLLSYFLS